MEFAEQLEFTNENNRFMRHCGIRLTRLEPGLCRAELDVAEYCKNTGDTVHGGLLYTMADCAVSAYARAVGDRPVTLSGDFHYLGNVTEGVIAADARLDHLGRTIQVYRVEVRSAGKLLAEGTFTCFRKGEAQE